MSIRQAAAFNASCSLNGGSTSQHFGPVGSLVGARTLTKLRILATQSHGRRKCGRADPRTTAWIGTAAYLGIAYEVTPTRCENSEHRAPALGRVKPAKTVCYAVGRPLSDPGHPATLVIWTHSRSGERRRFRESTHSRSAWSEWFEE